MIYIFTFKEIYTGSIKFESKKPFTNNDIIKEIRKGNAEYNSATYEDINLVEILAEPDYEAEDTS